jgi:hypothetical protein
VAGGVTEIAFVGAPALISSGRRLARLAEVHYPHDKGDAGIDGQAGHECGDGGKVQRIVLGEVEEAEYECDHREPSGDAARPVQGSEELFESGGSRLFTGRDKVSEWLGRGVVRRIGWRHRRFRRWFELGPPFGRLIALGGEIAGAELLEDGRVVAGVAEGAHFGDGNGVDGAIDLDGGLGLAAEVALAEVLLRIVEQFGGFVVRHAALHAEAGLGVEVAGGVFGDALGQRGGHSCEQF